MNPTPTYQMKQIKCRKNEYHILDMNNDLVYIAYSWFDAVYELNRLEGHPIF